jgi:RNA polymerase sigma-70 factor, ECF subfamily
MSDVLRTEITSILRDRHQGSGSAVTERLTQALYPELRRVAAGLMRRERRDHTLQPTALVSEAFVRLVDQRGITWQDRAHFLGIAAKVMRQILVDHARRHSAGKRGGGQQFVTFDEGLGHGAAETAAMLDLHRALDKLAAQDPRGAHVAELRIFGGLTIAETAEVTGVSERTVGSDWAVARLWLSRELSR